MENIDYSKLGGVVPCIIQDFRTNIVLMLGFMNKDSLSKTKETGRVTFYSRSRQSLWMKGETSGNYLEVREILQDCDNDTLLIKARPTGPVCHTGADTCFDEVNKGWGLPDLEATISDRIENPREDSYTSRLFQKGIKKIAQKVGEEAVELVLEADGDQKDLFLGEAADLLYHYLILLRSKDSSLEDVVEVLRSRQKS